MKRMLATLFYMFISFMGLSFISLILLVAALMLFGDAKPADLANFLRVLGGGQRYVLPGADYNRYQAFLKDEAAMRAEAEEVYGTGRTRVTSAVLDKGAKDDLQQALDNTVKALAVERDRVTEVMARSETLKGQLDQAREALSKERAKKETVESAAATKKFRAMLAAMDENNVAVYLTKIVREGLGPTEAARIVREHLAADLAATVVDEIIEADVRQQIIPLVENKFAGVEPAKVVDLFRLNHMSAQEMAVYLRQMNAPQAMGTFLRLNDEERKNLAPLLLSSR